MLKSKYLSVIILSFISIGIMSSFIFKKINSLYTSQATFKLPKDYEINTVNLRQFINATLREEMGYYWKNPEKLKFTLTEGEGRTYHIFQIYIQDEDKIKLMEGAKKINQVIVNPISNSQFLKFKVSREETYYQLRHKEISAINYAYDGISELKARIDELKVPKKFKTNNRYSKYRDENNPILIDVRDLNRLIGRLNNSFVELEVHLRSLDNTLLFLAGKTPKIELINHEIKIHKIIDFWGHIMTFIFVSLLLLIFSIIMTKKNDD